MLPIDWEINFGYYITYLGEVYYGIAIKRDFTKGDFYIIGKNKWVEYYKEQDGLIPQEDLEKFGIYISTKEIIEHWRKEIPALRDDYSVNWNGLASDYKKMYVFGAGASANCLFGEGKVKLKNSDFRPPLGNEMFAERFDSIIHKYPGLRQVLPKFESKGNNIESILEDDWLELMASRNIDLSSKHIHLQFYTMEIFELISKRISKEFFRYNLYSLFIQKLFSNLHNSVNPVIVSFNYDTILDSALEENLNITFSDMNKYMNPKANSPFLFFKPHGSWNWGWGFDRAKIMEFEPDIVNLLYQKRVTPATIYYNLLGPKMLVSDGWGLEAKNHPHSIGRITLNKNRIKIKERGGKYFPALLLPYRDKDEFVMPHAHQLQMEFVIPYIEELVLIGWKGNEKLFNTKLKEGIRSLKKIIIVNPDSDSVKEELSKYLELESLEIICVNSFEEYVLQIMI